MGKKTGISWCDSTWNPIIGYSRVSEGCRNCYTETMAARFSNGKTELKEDKLLDPIRWTKPRKIFVNSMSDLFHESIPDEWIDKIFAIMVLAPRHIFQILTKRPQRMVDYFKDDLTTYRIFRKVRFLTKDKKLKLSEAKVILKRIRDWPLPNVWFGITSEDQESADERIPLLLRTPAAIRFVSYEPAIERIDFSKHLWIQSEYGGNQRKPVGGWKDEPRGAHIDWIICGGESGPGARPFDLSWARSVRDQCKGAGVAFFMKQMGRFPVCEIKTTTARDCHNYAGHREIILTNRAGSNPFEWPKDLRVQEFPVMK